MFTLTIGCILYIFSWIISIANYSLGKDCLSRLLPICLFFAGTIFIYSIVVNIVFFKRLSKYNKLPIIKNFFGIFLSICLLIFLPLGSQSPSIMLIFIILIIILYWYIFINEIYNNGSNFLLMLPFFVIQEFKSIFLFVVMLFCIGLTIIQVIFIPISFLCSIGRGIPYLPKWKDLLVFKLLLS